MSVSAHLNSHSSQNPCPLDKLGSSMLKVFAVSAITLLVLGRTVVGFQDGVGFIGLVDRLIRHGLGHLGL